MKCKRVTNKTASLEFLYTSPVSTENPETPYQYVKIGKKFFAIKKSDFFCGEDSTKAFLLVRINLARLSLLIG